MIQLTLLKGDDEVTVSAPRRPLRTAAIPAAPAATPAPGPGYTRAFANERQNSRLPWPLGRHAWTPRWKLSLAPETPARFVLAMGDRTVVSA